MTSGNIEDDHNNAVVATASEMMKQQQDGIGNSHAMFKGMIDRLIKPRYNWKALLRKRMESGKSKIKNSDTNRKVSGLRSFIRGGALKFNNFGYNAEVIVVLDVSGSMHSGMIDALSEIAGMNRRREIRLITVDTQPMDDIMIKNDGIANAVSKDSFQMHLGGGTYISSAFEKLVKEKTRDSIIVNISDYEITSSDNNNLNLQIKRLRKKNNVIIELKVNDKVELINSTRRKK
jgi:predicted metal-dependent peptidase